MISDLYLNLIRNPHAPKTYRDLRDYYLSQGMKEEADGFAFLLYEKYKELLDDNNPSHNTK